MAGLLGNIGAALGGLLGSPRAKDALLLSIASGGDPRFAAGLMGQRNEMQRANKQDELYQLKMEEARRKADEARLAQQRQQQSQSALASLSLLSPEYQAMYRNDPAFQQAFRANQVAYGDPAAAEQSGFLAPLPTSTELPADARLYEWAKGNPEREAFINRANQQPLPANLQEWNAYQNMSPEQRAAYLAMKRSGQQYDVGGVPYVLNPDGTRVSLASPADVIKNEADRAAAAAEARVAGETRGTKIAEAPKTIAEAEQTIRLIDSALKHPGLAGATGVSGLLNPVMVRGDRKDFLVLVDQLRGGAFLQAYQSLKGGGQITEVEGKKAEQAQARLDTAQSDEAYITALNEMRKLLLERKAKAEALIPGSIVPNSSPSQNPKEAEAAALRAKHGL